MTLNRTRARSTRRRSIRTIHYAHPVYTPAGVARPGAPRRDQRPRPHALLRRLLGLGLPRGRRRRARVRVARARSGATRCVTAQRALRGHDPPPPLRGARARVPPPPRAGLRRPRRAAAACSAGASCARRPGLVRFRRADYLGDPARAARRRGARARRASAPARAPAGPVRLLTQPAHARPLLQPGQLLLLLRRRRRAPRGASSPRSPTRRGASATPTCCRAAATAPVLDGGSDKALHVSPFMGMDQRYDWRATRARRATLSVHIESREDGERAFDATLSLRRRAADAALAGRVTARYPAATLRVLALIYGHALRAEAASGVPVHPHPAADAPMTDARSPARIVLALLAPHRASAQLDVVEGGARATSSAAARPQATVAGPLAARVWPRCCAAAAAWPRPTPTACGTRPTSPRVIRVAARNVERARRACAAALAPLREPLPARRGAASRATRRAAAARDIAAHYDLGNELFELMLDPTMMYSCARLRAPRRDARGGLARQARPHLRQARPRPARPRARDRHRLGRLRACTPRATRGCRVTTTTISREQHDLRRRARRATAGLEDRVTVLLEDYRDLRGTLRQARLDRDDRGRRLAATSARSSRAARELLAPDGAMLLQAITIDDRAYEVEKASRSFIRTHIFPNGCLPSLEVIAALRRAATPTCAPSTSRTSPRTTPRRCARWRANVERERRRRSRRLGYDERFRRLWRLYLAYCEARLRRAPDRRRAGRARQAAWRGSVRAGATAPPPIATTIAAAG